MTNGEKVEGELPETHVLLRYFNDFIEGMTVGGISIGVTLTVNGTIISGNIISRDSWFEDLSKYFSKLEFHNSDPSLNADLEKMFRSAFLTISDGLKELIKGEQKDCVFLRDVDLILSPNQRIKMPIWCVPIEAVDGFSLGRIGVS